MEEEFYPMPMQMESQNFMLKMLPGKKYKINMEEGQEIHFGTVCLCEVMESGKAVEVYLSVDGCEKSLAAILRPGRVDMSTIDINLFEDDGKIELSCEGPCGVVLHGISMTTSSESESDDDEELTDDQKMFEKAALEEPSEEEEEEEEEEEPKKPAPKQKKPEPKPVAEKKPEPKPVAEKKQKKAKREEEAPVAEQPPKKKARKEPPAKTLEGGVKCEDVVVGSGTVAQRGDKCKVHYVLRLTPGGKPVDQSGKKPFVFTVGKGDVIRGWDVGVLGMTEGSKRRLVIPPAMAYGKAGAGREIPGNSTLFFEVSLVSVLKGKAQTPKQFKRKPKRGKKTV